MREHHKHDHNHNHEHDHDHKHDHGHDHPHEHPHDNGHGHDNAKANGNGNGNGNGLIALGTRNKKPRKIIASPKVLLIRPPQLFYFGVWPRGPRLSIPLGLLSIGSYLKGKGVDVEIYDCFVEGETFREDDELKAEYRGTGSLVSRWVRMFEDGGITKKDVKERKLHHFGATWERLEQDLLRIRPDIVAITNLFRENTEETLTTTRLVRRVLPDCTIIVGGPNANALPEYMLEQSDAIDAIGLSDGEVTMHGIVEWVQGKKKFTDIGNLVFRAPGAERPKAVATNGDANVTNKDEGPKVPTTVEPTIAVVRTATNAYLNDLDELGPLDYDLLKIERYFSYERNGIMARNKFSYPGAERSVSLVTSRGCPYKCSFCSIHIHAGRKYRRYSVEHTLDHLETLVRDYGVRHFHFEDDNLTLDRDRFHRLMDGILERKLEFTWDTPNGVFARTLDLEMMQKMKATGCSYLVIGVESGDQWVLDNVIRKQPLTIDDVLTAFRLGKEVGIDIQAFYIIGFPRESLAQIKRTLDFALNALREYDVIPHMAIARADPGTDLFKEAKESGTLRSDYAISNLGGVHADFFIRHAISTNEFTPEDLEKLNHDFHRQAMQIVAMKTASFLATHPKIALRNGGYFVKSLLSDNASVRDSLVKLFFCRLFYRHSLVRMDQKRMAKSASYQRPFRGPGDIPRKIVPVKTGTGASTSTSP